MCGWGSPAHGRAFGVLFPTFQPILVNVAMASLADLPDDVILHVLELCAIEDALTLTQVCLCSSVCAFEGH